jgi:hypothetical protein
MPYPINGVEILAYLEGYNPGGSVTRSPLFRVVRVITEKHQD